MKHTLHIVAFDVPFPPNYGGAIDVFYRIVALHNAGVDIILHCFDYARPHAPELERYCSKVYYYKRKTSLIAALSALPYAVIGRKNPELLRNLLADSHPILFEGLVSCGYMNHPELANRTILFRECNIEHHYYHALAKATRSPLKALYYRIEAVRLERFEQVLRRADFILTLSESDQKYFETNFPSARVMYVACFHAHSSVESSIGSSDYILYHGNLAVPENEKAAIYLCNEVFSKIKHRCVISGRQPSQLLQRVVGRYRNITLIPDPDSRQNEELIKNAHIHLLVTYQSTGIKLKLIDSLFIGRHVVANSTMLSGSGLSRACHIADSATGQIDLCNKLMSEPFSDTDLANRIAILSNTFSNSDNAQAIVGCLS